MWQTGTMEGSRQERRFKKLTVWCSRIPSIIKWKRRRWYSNIIPAPQILIFHSCKFDAKSMIKTYWKQLWADMKSFLTVPFLERPRPRRVHRQGEKKCFMLMKKKKFFFKAELRSWMMPADYDQHQAEAQHLIHEADRY